ncbi:MAG: type IV secretion system DNA-binding domain-containing protein [Parcubacteria group bacterium]|jgi:CxxC-x17-CxxC domain-containing protein
MQDITFFAKTNFRNQNVKFGIKTSDRQRHMYVIGKTGMGKTTLLENMVMQDIANGYGVAYIDPHGDTAEKLIKAIPANRINDVVYFNPADTEFPIAFNILESVSEDKKHLVASGMMGVFKKIWPDVWSARMEYILSNALLALLDYPGSTMMGVNRMMSDKKYRQRVYEKIKDPVVKGFWIDEFETWEDRFRKEAVAAIQNKVGQFLSSFLIRNIVGQTKSTINMRDIMDNNKILIVNLSKGRIGEDAMRLLGGMIVTKIQLAAMERVDMPEEERKNFYLTVDEFQNFVTESFANILSEARKYRLNLLVAHQYISQLETDTSSVVKDAIFGNVGTIISFRVGAEDAEFLEKEFEPVFMMNDIVNLPKYSIYLKLMIDGIAGNAFSATALPPIDITGTTENAEKVIRISRERYAKDRKDIEEKIARWTGMLTKESVAKMEPKKVEQSYAGNTQNYNNTVRNARNTIVIKPKENLTPNVVANAEIRKEIINDDKNVKISEPVVVKEKQETLLRESQPVIIAPPTGKEEIKVEAPEIIKVADNEKELFDSECDTCGEKIQIPFKPDGQRPTFCKDCLKDYQRAIARIQNEELENKRRIAEDDKNFDNIKKDVSKKEDVYNRPNIQGKIETQQRVYSPKEKPLSLSQTTFMAPKKIKNMNAGRELLKLKEIIEKNNQANNQNKNIDSEVKAV